MKNKRIVVIIFCLFFLVPLAMAQDWEIPENSITPMTGYNSPSPFKVSSNSEWDSYYAAWKAFDGKKAWTHWISKKIDEESNETAHIMYQYNQAKTIYSYLIRGRFDSLKNRLAKSWELQGSVKSNANVADALNSSNWIKLDERNGISLNDEWNSTTSVAEVFYNVQNPGNYNRYRLCVKSVNGSTIVDILEIQLFQSRIKRPCVSYNAVVPMTSDHTPNPYRVDCADEESGYEGWRAFDYKVDREGNNKPWAFMSRKIFDPAQSAYGNLLAYSFSEPTIITSYRVIVPSDSVYYEFSLEGSNNINSGYHVEDAIYVPNNWEVLHVRDEIPDWDNWIYDPETDMYSQTFDIPNPGAYQYYLFKIVEDNPNFWEIDEIQLLVTEEYK